MSFDQLFFDQFRFGTWPDYFEGVQLDQSPETLEQFLRSVTPDTGPYDPNVIADAMSALVDRLGTAVLFTHSQGGGPGWLTAMRNEYVRRIVAYEPGSGFVLTARCRRPCRAPPVRWRRKRCRRRRS